MMKKNVEINSAEALRLALEEFGMTEKDLRGDVTCLQTEDLFELHFCGEWMEYTVYVDASGEVLGRLAEPTEEVYNRCEVIPFLRSCCSLAG